MSFHVPSHIVDIKPYEPGKSLEQVGAELGLTDVIKLASNESPLGPPEACLEIIKENLHSIHQYPEDGHSRLVNKTSEIFNIPAEHILFGAGSAELIVYSAKTFLNQTSWTLTSQQTFVMYYLASKYINGKLKLIPTRNYHYDLDAMAAAIDSSVSLIYIANPNNPTGTMFTEEEFDRFMSKVPDHVIVVYDEAYREYVSDPQYPDSLKYYRRGDNIIILRTFSKIYALAGLRIGYAIARSEILDFVRRLRMPFNVSSLALFAAEAALDAKDHVAESININNAGKKYLSSELGSMGLNYIPSEANFIFVDMGYNTNEIFEKMQAEGVIIRPLSGFGIPTAIRISVGLPAENEKCISALRKVLAES